MKESNGRRWADEVRCRPIPHLRELWRPEAVPVVMDDENKSTDRQEEPTGQIEKMCNPASEEMTCTRTRPSLCDPLRGV